MNFLLIVVALNVASLVFNLLMAGVAALGKIRVYEFGIGFGPRLFGFRLGRTQVNIRLIPFGDFLRFDDPNELNTAADVKFATLPLFTRILLLLGPPLTLVGIGVMLTTLPGSRWLAALAITFLWTGLIGLLPIPFQNGLVFLCSLSSRMRERNLREVLPWWFVALGVLIHILAFVGLLTYYGFHADDVVRFLYGTG